MSSDRRAPAARRRPFAPAAALAAALAVAGAGSSANIPGPVRVGVLLSQDSPQGQQAIQGFERSLRAAGVDPALQTYLLDGDPAKAAPALQKARAGEFQLVLALGSVATQAAARSPLPAPIVGGLVLRSADLGGAANVTGTVLEFPVETELRWLRQVLPSARRIGVLYSPQNNQSRVDAASAAARGMGLTLLARRVDSPRGIPQALESIAGEADVLWGLADPVVLTPETAQPILLFSFRNRIPFVGLSQSWAKAGALYALDRDYPDIGAQCGELAVKALSGQSPSALPAVPPRKVVYWLNLKTAKHMKVELAPELIKGAQDVFN